MKKIEGPTKVGQRSYKEWRDQLHENPEYQAIYKEESAKMELWLQLADARQASGLTQAEVAKKLGVSQAQVARIEKRGYDAYTLKVKVHHSNTRRAKHQVGASL